MLKRYTKNDLPQISKAAAFSNLEVSFDYALPQQWLDNFSSRTNLNYHLILLTTVWAYPDNYIFGFPVSICKEVQDEIDKEFINEKEVF